MCFRNETYRWQPTKPPTSFWLFALNGDKWQEVYFGLALWNLYYLITLKADLFIFSCESTFAQCIILILSNWYSKYRRTPSIFKTWFVREVDDHIIQMFQNPHNGSWIKGFDKDNRFMFKVFTFVHVCMAQRMIFNDFIYQAFLGYKLKQSVA